ncbi:P-II family nitrogen regulator [Elusimicrobiota bacterium]
MKLLVIILNKTEFLNELLSILVEVGISKATILDSEGLGQHLAHDIPIFAGLKSLVGDSKTYNKTIMALVDDDSLLKDLKKLLKETDIDFSKEGMGLMFTLLVDKIMDLED